MKPIKIAISSFALCLFATPALAEQDTDHTHMEHADHATMDHSGHTDAARPALQANDVAPVSASGEIITAKVNGLVCDFCAQSIRKVFGKQAAVETINVDLDNGEIVLSLKKGETLDDETIGTLIRKSGYALVGIERGDGA